MLTQNKQGEKKTSQLFKNKGDCKVIGDWAKQSSALRIKYPKLTSDDVKFETGKETDLFNRIETRLNKNRNEVIDILKTNHEACC